MILVAAMVAVGMGGAQTSQKKVAVATFDVVGNVVTPEDAEAITELYINGLVRTGKVSIFDRKNFDTILAELKFQSGDWASKEKTVELQKATGATVLGRGQIFKLGSSFYISATMIDANTAEILSASKKSFKDIDELVELLDTMASEISTAISKVVMKYKIGDTGPGGGIVFYASEEGFDVLDGKGGIQKCNYMEVSKTDLGVKTWCYCVYKDKKGKEQGTPCNIICSDKFGFGKSNTYKIISYHSGASSSNCAAYACYRYSTPTSNAGEWFLPSTNELSYVFQNVGDRILATASSSSFISSSHWVDNRGNHYVSWYSTKDKSFYWYSRLYSLNSVLAVRAFSN